MILFVEGPRSCGKTYLIENFLAKLKEQQKQYPLDPVFFGVEYYKFYFANHIKTLGLQDLDATPALHYFSLGNIMSIMEMNLRPQYQGHTWIFDRAIISAYAWAVLRNRLTPNRARDEYRALLSSELYQNCKTIVIAVDRQTNDNRGKDMFDGAHSTEEEYHQLGHFLDFGVEFLSNQHRNNSLSFITNTFNETTQRFNDDSDVAFTAECYRLLGIPPNK
jgi:thymidylate kinase